MALHLFPEGYSTDLEKLDDTLSVLNPEELVDNARTAFDYAPGIVAAIIGIVSVGVATEQLIASSFAASEGEAVSEELGSWAAALADVEQISRDASHGLLRNIDEAFTDFRVAC